MNHRVSNEIEMTAYNQHLYLYECMYIELVNRYDRAYLLYIYTNKCRIEIISRYSYHHLQLWGELATLPVVVTTRTTWVDQME